MKRYLKFPKDLLEYEKGDYITGIDRSFKRSIYKCIGHRFRKKILFKAIAYSGRYYGDLDETFPMRINEAKKYRKATLEERRTTGAISNSHSFIMEDL